MDDGTTFDYTDIAKGLWNSGKTDLNPQVLARVLQNEGATATEIAQAFNYGLEFKLEVIANALDDGATFNYTDIAKGLWNSGKTDFNSQVLARVLQNEGATATEIAQAFNYGLEFKLEVIANALDDGATFNYTSIAEALWNSGKTDFNSQVLARVLQDEGATATEIAQAFNYVIGRTLEGIAFDLDEGTTFNYTEIARGLWSSGKAIDAPTLAKVLQNEGATATEIAQALNYGIGATLEQIADALDDGATFDYTDIAKGLWNSGKTDFNSQVLARVLQNEGATATEIAQAFNYGIRFDLETIADALDDGTTFNYTDIAYALWNSGKAIGSNQLAGLLENEGATALQIAQALNYGIGRSLEGIAFDLDEGTTFDYTDIAKALGNSGKNPDTRTLARVLQNEGATATQIAQAFNYGFRFNIKPETVLVTIADALDDGTSFSYTDIAKGLWNSGKAINSKQLAGLLQNEGANETEIAQALNYSVGLTLEQIADALDDGTTFNYTNVAKGLWNSGKAIRSSQLAGLLQDEGATATQIAQALNFGIGRRLEEIALDLDEGTTFNYISIAEALWNSGKSLDSRDLARVLQDEGADAIQVAQALNFGIGLDKKQIADALDDGATFNYSEIADAIWNGVGGLTDFRLVVLLREEGAGVQDTINAVSSVTRTDRWIVAARVAQVALKDIISSAIGNAKSVVNSVNNFYQDNKENVSLVLNPVGFVANQITPGKVDSVLQGSLEVATNPLKIVELGRELGEKALSPILDKLPLAGQLLEKLEDSLDPFSIASSYLGDASAFISEQFKNLESKRDEVHEILDAAGTAQTIATNTVLYTLEGDFKNAWKSFQKDPAINDLIDSVRDALKGNIRDSAEAAQSFLKAGGIDTPEIPKEGIKSFVNSNQKKLKNEAYKALSNFGISLKTIKAAAGEPGYTTDDQMHAIFSILAYYNIPYVSAGALAVNTGYYISEASKQFNSSNETEGIKRLLTGAASAAKLQNAYDWINAVWALQDVDFDKFSSSKSVGAYKEVLGSVLEAIDVEDGKEWVFGAFDLADGKYSGALGNVAIALADIEDKDNQENIKKWANVLNVLIDKEANLSSGNYRPVIQEVFTKLGITDSALINSVLAKGNNEETLKQAIKEGARYLTDENDVDSDDAEALVNLVFGIRNGIKTGNFSPVLQEAFSYVGIDDGATQIVAALSSLKNGNYEEVLKGVLSAAKFPGAAGLIEAGKVLRDGIKSGDIDFDLEFEKGEKEALIKILRATGASSPEDRADKAEDNFQ